jgi:hypothetical protein
MEMMAVEVVPSKFIITCDRCQKSVESDTNVMPPQWINLESETDLWVLCDDCNNSFQEWIKGQ